jgi:hypothetical protein
MYDNGQCNGGSAGALYVFIRRGKVLLRCLPKTQWDVAEKALQ